MSRGIPVPSARRVEPSLKPVLIPGGLDYLRASADCHGNCLYERTSEAWELIDVSCESDDNTPCDCPISPTFPSAIRAHVAEGDRIQLPCMPGSPEQVLQRAVDEVYRLRVVLRRTRFALVTLAVVAIAFGAAWLMASR